MSLRTDYSKWDKLEISSDEDSFHPNLDKGLNIRVNRITRDRKEEEIDEKKKALLEEGKVREAEKLEKKRPLHAGNVCKVSEDRTIIRSAASSLADRSRHDEDFSMDEYTAFKTRHKQLLDAFTDASWEQSKEMLMAEGATLMDTNASHYFMLTCLDEEMKGNREQVLKLARQGQIIFQIHQLAEPAKRPARDLVPRFFERFDHPHCQAAFQEGVDNFLKHITNRAVEKKKEQSEEEREMAEAIANAEDCPFVEAMYHMSVEERRGPGGLDPVEVFESLPPMLQESFKSLDMELLEKAQKEMDPEEFKHHLQRCCDSGLWQND